MSSCNAVVLVRQPRANVACGGVGAYRMTWLPAPPCKTGSETVAKTCEQASSGVRNVGCGGPPGTTSTSSVGQLRCNTKPLATNSSLISIMPEAYYWHCCATVSGVVGYVFLLPGHSEIRTSTLSVKCKRCAGPIAVQPASDHDCGFGVTFRSTIGKMCPINSPIGTRSLGSYTQALEMHRVSLAITYIRSSPITVNNLAPQQCSHQAR
jgi:hypothetical protein